MRRARSRMRVAAARCTRCSRARRALRRKRRELGKYGADVVIVVEHAGLANANAESLAATASARIKAGGYRAAIFSASAQGRDLAPRVAAQLGVSMASDVTSFELAGDALVVKHPAYAGKVIATLKLTGSPAIVTLRPGARAAVEAAREARVETGATRERSGRVEGAS